MSQILMNSKVVAGLLAVLSDVAAPRTSAVSLLLQ